MQFLSRRPSQHGFTLMELAIVLVVMGLIVGGVVAGKEMIRNTRLKTIPVDFQRYQQAALSFKDRFRNLPGDMPNATEVWGIAGGSTGNDNTCRDTASTGVATCNGDGNKTISHWAGSAETFRFWQHLANAGLITGNYDGIAHGSNIYAGTLANSAGSKIDKRAIWFVWDWRASNSVGSGTVLFATPYGNNAAHNFIMLGNMQANVGPYDPVVTPDEAYSIDNKMDDGKPATGKLVVFDIPNCTTGTLPAHTTATYRRTNTNLACGLVFTHAF